MIQQLLKNSAKVRYRIVTGVSVFYSIVHRVFLPILILKKIQYFKILENIFFFGNMKYNILVTHVLSTQRRGVVRSPSVNFRGFLSCTMSLIVNEVSEFQLSSKIHN